MGSSRDLQAVDEGRVSTECKCIHEQGITCVAAVMLRPKASSQPSPVE